METAIETALRVVLRDEAGREVSVDVNWGGDDSGNPWFTAYLRPNLRVEVHLVEVDPEEVEDELASRAEDGPDQEASAC
jgi:hypothetical protein